MVKDDKVVSDIFSGIVVLEIDIAASFMLYRIFSQCDSAGIVSVDDG